MSIGTVKSELDCSRCWSRACRLGGRGGVVNLEEHVWLVLGDAVVHALRHRRVAVVEIHDGSAAGGDVLPADGEERFLVEIIGIAHIKDFLFGRLA